MGKRSFSAAVVRSHASSSDSIDSMGTTGGSASERIRGRERFCRLPCQAPFPSRLSGAMWQPVAVAHPESPGSRRGLLWERIPRLAPGAFMGSIQARSVSDGICPIQARRASEGIRVPFRNGPPYSLACAAGLDGEGFPYKPGARAMGSCHRFSASVRIPRQEIGDGDRGVAERVRL